MTQIIRKTVCPHDCPDTCSILATVADGRVTNCDGDPDHPFTRGGLCHKVHRYAERIYSPLRILQPLRRAGEKGEGKFIRISWDEALAEVADRLKAIAIEFGGEAILPFSYGGTLGLVQRKAGHAFFHRLGATRLKRNICDTAAEEAWLATYGACIGTDMEGIEPSDLVILWGINAVHTNLHGMHFVNRARRNGARLVVIDPYRNRTAKLADLHLMPRPGTDAALALGIACVLIQEELIDRTYIQAQTFGFDEYKREALNYPPTRAAEISGVAAEAILDLARAYGSARAPFIRVGNGLQRHTNGGQAIRAIACLPGLTGAFAHPGGGALWESFGAFPVNFAAIEAEHLQPHATREVNMVQLGDALLALDKPPIKALFVYQANPAANIPDQSKVVAGLGRSDLFTVVHEQIHTDTVDFPDIVLPATTSFEHMDLYRSYGHYHLQLAHPVIPPQGEAQPNLQLMTPPSKDFLNTSFGSVERMCRSEGKPRLKIHPEDAKTRMIVHDALVRVYNRRGDCLLYAEVTEDVPPGVLVAESIWWSKHHPGRRGINQLTSQRLTDLGECSTLHENLVNVAVAEAEQSTDAAA